MTEATHYARGTCCGSHCRHCPFEFAAVVDYPTPVHPIRIRRAVEVDVPALVPLARQTFAASYIAMQEDVAGNYVPYLERAFTMAVFAKALRDPREAWWVAHDGEGRLWGYAALVNTPGHARGTHQLKRLYLRRQARGRGAGQQLLHAAERYAAETYIGEAVAKTRQSGPLVWLETNVLSSVMNGFYVPQGYSRVGTDYWQLGTQRFEVAVMTKERLHVAV